MRVPARNRRPDGTRFELPAPLDALLAGRGTLTHALEALHHEPLRAARFGEWVERFAVEMPELGLPAGREVVRRRVILEGRVSRRAFVFADALVVVARLPDEVVVELERTDLPMGEILARHGAEVARDRLSTDVARLPESVPRLGRWSRSRRVPTRTDRLTVDGVPVMLLSEWFLPDCGGPLASTTESPPTGSGSSGGEGRGGRRRA